MTNKNQKLNLSELFKFLLSQCMVAKQRTKYLDKKWKNFITTNDSPEHRDYAQRIFVVREMFNRKEFKFLLEQNFGELKYSPKKIQDETSDEAYMDAWNLVLETANTMLENLTIIGMSDLEPKAYQTFHQIIYDEAFENFESAANSILWLNLKNFRLAVKEFVQLSHAVELENSEKIS